jgi:hypothetical protein
MSGEPDEFRRILLDLGHAAEGEGGVRAAVELAGLLRLDLLGVFVADEAVLSLAGLPLARELRLPGCAWSRLDAARIAEEFEAAARRARRLLEDQCARLGVRAAFEFLRGDPAAALAALARPHDIVAVGGAGSPAERARGPLPRAMQAALRSAASVMLLPQRIARRAGPVATLAATPTDPGLRVAAGIAAAARERLLLLLPPGLAPGEQHAAVAAAARAARLSEDQVVTRGLRDLTADAILDALEGARERLLVLSRASARAAQATPPLTAVRGVPALLIGPAKPAAEVAEKREGAG